MNVDKMRHQLRRAEAHAPGAAPWTPLLAALDRQVERLARVGRIPAARRVTAAWSVPIILDETAAWRDKVAEREADYAPAWRAALEAAEKLD